MPWNGLTSNQAVSDTNLKDAVTTGVFVAGSIPFPSPTQNKEVTKGRCSGYIDVPNVFYPPFYLKPDNQIIVKGDIYAPGDFIIDPAPAYGKQFDSLSGTGVPSFSYPVTSGNTTLPYNGKIPSQTFTMQISGSSSYTDLFVSLYVDSTLIAVTSYLSQYGTDYPSLYLPFDVYSPSTIRFAINSGTIPSPSGSDVTIGSSPINNVAVSRTNGQYQFATIGKTQPVSRILIQGSLTPGYVKVATQAGELLKSNDYGNTWKRTSVYDYWKKMVVSDSGQVIILIPNYGYPLRSGDYGATWSRITSVGSRFWTGLAMSNDGTYVTITGYDTPTDLYNTATYIYRSTNSGSTWSAPSSYSSTKFAFTAVSMSSTGQYQTALKIYERAYYSTDYGNTWSDYTLSTQGYFIDLANNPYNNGYSDQQTIAVYIPAGFTLFNSSLLKSSNYGASWSTSNTTNDGIIIDQMFNYVGNSNYALYNPDTYKYIQGRSNSNFYNITSPGTAKWWQCFAAAGSANYILAGSTSGLLWSSDNGNTFYSR